MRITKARRGAKVTKYKGREERTQHNVGRIVYLKHRCVPQLEINGWTAMLYELEDQVEAFFEFDVTIGACVADALCAAWWWIQQGSAGEDTASRREHLPRPARRPAGGRRKDRGKRLVM